MIHEAGYTYNDLKLDNVLIGEAKELPNHMDSLHKIKVIDFGLAKKYINNGMHIECGREKLFQGNMIFASKNAFNMKTQSRRDDLISLCYFLLYLVDGDLAFLQDENDDDAPDQQEEFSRIKKMKNLLTPELLCSESAEGKRLQPFFDDIFALEFESQPNYDKLRFTLVKGLLNLNETPNKVYDWNADYMRNHGSRAPAQVYSGDEQDDMLNTDEGLASNTSDSLMCDMRAHDKMIEMRGYQFCPNVNHEAMQKIIQGKI